MGYTRQQALALGVGNLWCCTWRANSYTNAGSTRFGLDDAMVGIGRASEIGLRLYYIHLAGTGHNVTPGGRPTGVFIPAAGAMLPQRWLLL